MSLKEGAFSLAGSFLHIHFNSLYTWALNLRAWSIYQAYNAKLAPYGMTMWNDYDKILVILDKLSVKNLSYLHELG